jgi:glycosyltransferase involved in cell wall biosynthesis
MKTKFLLSSPLGAPGPMTALKNHQAILRTFCDADLISLEDLVSPQHLNARQARRVWYRICKKTKIVWSVEKIIPYGENVIFGTFSPIHEGIIRKLNRLGIRPSFLWCSTLSQMEFTPHEMKLFMRLVEFARKGNIKYLFLQHRLFDSMGYFVKEAKLLPYSIDLHPYADVRKTELPGVHVDLFCRPRFGKNILSQIGAFSMAKIDGTLHINFDTKQFGGIVEEMIANISRHNWIPVDEYLSLVAGMMLSLQVTIGESFNYAVCERMCLGVPVLTTKDIYLVGEDQFLARHLCIEAPDTPSVIAEAIRNIVRDKKLRAEIAQRCKSRIADVAKRNNKVVIEQLMHYFL